MAKNHDECCPEEDMTLIPRSHIALDRVLKSWDGTRFIRGQGTKGVGTDCYHFVARVLDELYDLPPTPLPPLSQVRTGHFAVIHEMMKKYPNRTLRIEEPLEPGDVLIISSGNSFCHVMLVGTEANVLWNVMQGVGVCRSSLATVIHAILHRYRPLEQEKWK